MGYVRVLPVIVEVGLLVYCLIDCIQTDEGSVRNLGKSWWVLLIILLPLVESAFGFVTGSKLLELTSSELPIFRQLSEEAPGSYHHSLIVASLAEKAAEELGIDAQLAKAGALYHDIGKTKMPEYFIENRTREFDLHKDLSPSMSTLVIKNHVKEGAELARKLKLPRPLREIIEQHHGNSLVRYFYAKAKQTYDPLEQTVGDLATRDDVRMLGEQILQLQGQMIVGFSALREVRSGEGEEWRANRLECNSCRLYVRGAGGHIVACRRGRERGGP